MYTAGSSLDNGLSLRGICLRKLLDTTQTHIWPRFRVYENILRC